MGKINKKYDVSKDINDLKKNGVSQENINTAVNDYFTEHPVTSGATAEQVAQIKTNKTDIASLKVNKYDDVSLSGSNLAFKANGSTMKTITLPSSGSADTSAFFNDVSVAGSTMKFSNGSNVLKTVTLPSGSSGAGSLPDSEYLVRDAVRDYGAIGDGTKRSIKSVDSSVTLSEVQAVRSDATLDD